MVDESGNTKLLNVMVNFLSSNQLIFGDQLSFAIFYKQSHKDFSVFKKALVHDFQVTIKHDNFEGSIGLNVPDENLFIVS